MLEGAGLGWTGPSFLAACLSQGAYLRSPPARIQRTGRDPARGMALSPARLCLEDGPLRDDALRHIAPECHQKLAGERHDGDPADPSTSLPDTRTKPGAQGRVRLMAKPEPSQLHQGMAQATVAGFGNTLLVVGPAALPRARRQARIAAR